MEALKQCRIRKTIVTTTTTISPDFSDGEAESYFDLEFPLTSDDNNTNEEDDDGILFSDDDFSDENEENDDENEVIVSRHSVHLHSSTIIFEKDNSKSPVSFLKPPSKFQFLLLKLKKQKSNDEKVEKNDESSEVEEKQEKSGNSFFAVYKLKVEEMKLPLVSLFTRDNNNSSKEVKVDDVDSNSNSNGGCDERKLSKEMMQKYLKMVKPLYVQLTKNYMGRIKFSGHLTFPKGVDSEPTPCSETNVVGKATTAKGNQKQGNNTSVKNMQTGLKIVKKHLGKSRSDSAIVAGKVVAAGSCDDSMAQVQDGIQGAILHCKKSLSSSNE